MTIRSKRSLLRSPFPLLCATLALLSFGFASARTAQSQTTQVKSTQSAIQPRITGPIDNTSRAVLAGSRSPQAIPADDVGAIPSGTQFQGISITFSRTPAQESDLQALLAAQQNPASPLYHQWLSPAQFGARFGVAAADIAAVEGWLQQQGFAVGGVSNSRDRITFSGTAAQVEAAFGTPIHYFKSGAETHFAPAGDLSLPSALATSILSVSNLSDFRPHPHITRPVARPDFTSATSGNHFLTPGDVATIYDIKAVYSAGYNGAGQSIAVMGESAIVSTDITNFQAAAGVTAKLPTLVLVPGTGASAISTVAGVESEADLDLEYSSTIAPGANIYFVYTGNSSNNGGAFTALTYAIDNNVAPILSLSFGSCEPALPAGFYTQMQGVLAQAAVQGETVVTASGDQGSSGCYGLYTSAAQNEVLAVGYPVSSQYVTGIGGTEFPAAAVISGNNTYFSAASGGDVISSALSYIPEQAWNDDAVDGSLASGGGGISTLTPRPTWQTGVPGIAAGSYRLVPDISLDSSADYAPYAYCTSDQTAWATQANGASPPYQQSSCNSGLRDSYSNDLTIAGGTSFATPIFAGMLALINQAKGYTTGQGIINTTLYSLAAIPATYASAFHDINSGSNECLAGTTYCIAATQAVYPATIGYDEATGLGSVDLNNLIAAWPKAVTSGLTSSITTLKAASASPALSAPDVITITVASASATVTTVPTGTVSVTVDGALVNSALALVNGTVTYTFASAVSGSHVITVAYSGDAHFAASTGTVSVIVGATSFNLAATSVAVTAGSSGTSTVTVTPVNGYIGTVAFTLNTFPTTLVLSNVCYKIANVPVTSATAVTTSMTIATSSSACAALVQRGSGTQVSWLRPNGDANPLNSKQPRPAPWSTGGPAGLALAGLAAVFCLRRRSRLLRASVSLGVLALLSITGAGLTGCSNNAAAASVKATSGTYTLTLTGTDTVTSTITTAVNFTLTIN